MSKKKRRKKKKEKKKKKRKERKKKKEKKKERKKGRKKRKGNYSIHKQEVIMNQALTEIHPIIPYYEFPPLSNRQQQTNATVVQVKSEVSACFII